MLSVKIIEDRLNDPVTDHMLTDFAKLRMGQTVGEALSAIQHKPPEDRIIYLYVVDDENRLLGLVPILSVFKRRVSESKLQEPSLFFWRRPSR